MDRRRDEILRTLGVARYVPRDGAGAAPVDPFDPAAAPADPTPAVTPAAGVETLDWEELARTVAACTRCGLEATRTQTVFGVGDRDADWLVVGEAPGAEEDRRGEPFVGRAGQLLDAMLRALKLARGERVYVANVLKCLRYTALVQLEDGSWERIGRLVRSRYRGRVMSVGPEGQLVPRRVIGWHSSALAGRRVYKLSYGSAKSAGSHPVGIELTGDHPVLTERGFVPVDQIVPGDRVATGQGLSELAFDVVCGTLLGDGHIPKAQSLLSFGHSARQREYALFKAQLLEELSPVVEEHRVAAGAGMQREHDAVLVRTRAHRALRILRAGFYAGAKKAPSWLADRLSPRMLAIWFMDDGHTRIRPGRQPLAEIATCCFRDDDLGVLVAGLERLGVSPSIRRGRLYFDVQNSRRLSEIIAPYVPGPMRYKVHPEVSATVPFDPSLMKPGERRALFDEVVVTDVTDRPRSDVTFFCIDVEDTHNFVTSGGVVHNCRPPNNRDPTPREVACCLPYLHRQIALLRPKVILCVGRIAAQNLLGTDEPLGKLRGRTHRLEPSGTPVVVTYHPAYLLRSPGEKRKAWTDLQYAQEVARGHGA